MIITWWLFISGIVLAWLPPRLIRLDEFRFLTFDQLTTRLMDQSRRRRRWWKSTWVWVEPFRALAAAFALRTSIMLAPESELPRLLPTGIVGVILLISILLQVGSRQEKPEILIPIGYTIGLLFGLMPPVVALAAVILGISSAAAIQSWESGIIVATLAVVGLEVFLAPRDMLLVFTPILVATPLFLSWLLNRKLVLPIRI